MGVICVYNKFRLILFVKINPNEPLYTIPSTQLQHQTPISWNLLAGWKWEDIHFEFTSKTLQVKCIDLRQVKPPKRTLPRIMQTLPAISWCVSHSRWRIIHPECELCNKKVANSQYHTQRIVDQNLGKRARYCGRARSFPKSEGLISETIRKKRMIEKIYVWVWYEWFLFQKNRRMIWSSVNTVRYCQG